MSKELIIIFVLALVVVVVGEFIIKTISNKAAEKVNERANRRKAQQGASAPESLADRYKGK